MGLAWSVEKRADFGSQSVTSQGKDTKNNILFLKNKKLTLETKPFGILWKTKFTTKNVTESYWWYMCWIVIIYWFTKTQTYIYLFLFYFLKAWFGKSAVYIGPIFN